MNLQALCSRFTWVPTDEGGHLVTPWRYDDGDQVVVFARREGPGWRLDDNGEGLLRLAMAGVDPDSERVRSRLAAFPRLLAVHLLDDGETLSATASADAVADAALAVAEASTQIQGLATLRQIRQPSDFRERVTLIVEEVARTYHAVTQRDVPVDESQSILADVYVRTPTPLIVIAASTPQRLLEAEILWLDAARRQQPAYVLATVESAQAVGLAQYTRANYYTDKTVEYASREALANLVALRMQPTTRNAPLH